MLPKPGIDLIKRWEGCSLKPYLCPAGVTTIGYGHIGPASKKERISQSEADELLRLDAESHYLELLHVSPGAMFENENRRGALLSFVFNLGASNYKASTLKKRVDSGNWKDVPRQLNRWVFAGGRPLRGLVLRRQAEGDLCLK